MNIRILASKHAGFVVKLGTIFVLWFLLRTLSSLVHHQAQTEHILGSKSISLSTRQNDRVVNDVFKDNILLTLAYLDGQAQTGHPVAWDKILKPTSYEFTLNPGKTFSFHDDVLPAYKNTVTMSTHAHFIGTEGFKSDGYLMGDGVCHFASLLYWAARDAGLAAYAPTNHNFAYIPEIPREYGVAIYNDPSATDISAMQNLYITNNKSYPVTLRISYDGQFMKTSVISYQKIEEKTNLALLTK